MAKTPPFTSRSFQEEIGRATPIASVSLGATRKFLLRGQNDKTDQADLVLENGSLVIMENECQHKYVHCIPKEKDVADGRINLTFRCKGAKDELTPGEEMHKRNANRVRGADDEAAPTADQNAGAVEQLHKVQLVSVAADAALPGDAGGDAVVPAAVATSWLSWAGWAAAAGGGGYAASDYVASKGGAVTVLGGVLSSLAGCRAAAAALSEQGQARLAQTLTGATPQQQRAIGGVLLAAAGLGAVTAVARCCAGPAVDAPGSTEGAVVFDVKYIVLVQMGVEADARREIIELLSSRLIASAMGEDFDFDATRLGLDLTDQIGVLERPWGVPGWVAVGCNRQPGAAAAEVGLKLSILQKAISTRLLQMRSAVHVLEYHGHFELPPAVAPVEEETAEEDKTAEDETVDSGAGVGMEVERKKKKEKKKKKKKKKKTTNGAVRIYTKLKALLVSLKQCRKALF